MGKKKKVKEAESYRRCNNHFKNVKEEVVCACGTGTSKQVLTEPILQQMEKHSCTPDAAISLQLESGLIVTE